MVRISGGIHRGRKLQVPKSGVRPTKDMVRQALFSAIGASIEGKRVLDVFAGSGVIGLEAVSRGAAEAVWVESDTRTFAVLQENVALICGPDQTGECYRADARVWLGSVHGPSSFDLIVADPPYEPETGTIWGDLLLEALEKGNKLAPAGLFVLEQHMDQPVIDNPGWNILKEGTYGETRLVYYRRKTPETST